MTTTDENPNKVDWVPKTRRTQLSKDYIRAVCEGLTVDCYREAIRNGHYNDPETGESIRYTARHLIELASAELKEAWYADRHDDMDKHLPHRLGVEVEIADALIILFGACGHLGLDIGNAMAEKLEYNRTRKDREKARRSG